MRYAIVENGIVANVALSDYPLAENWIEDPDGLAQIGGAYDGNFQAAPEKTPAAAEYEAAIDAHLNMVAQQHGYDNIISACSYAGAVNPFQLESMDFVEWRGNVWQHCLSVLDDVKNGRIPVPSIEELIAELPAFGE